MTVFNPASEDPLPVTDRRYWIPTSPFTRRQDAVGACAENNGGTELCKPGQCSLCDHCTFNLNNKIDRI